MNIDTVYSLKIKLGEATTTTAPSVVCSYSIMREKTERGAVSGVASPQVATATTNGTSEVEILTRTSTSALDNRYRIDSLYVCNRDTVAHTVYLFYETAGGTESYITSGVSIAAGATLQVASDGTISRVPDSSGVLSVGEGGTGATSFTDGAFLIGNGTNAVQVVGPGTAGQIPVSQGAGADPIMRTMSGDATLSSAGALTLATYMNFGGRLTLTSGTAVTTSDVTGASTIYYTPYIHNRVPIYASGAWSMRTFTERSLALGTITSGRPYDVFIYDSSGTLTLELLAWTSDTARATALTTQDGVYVKSGDATRVYLGTFRTTSTTQTEDSNAKRFLWNMYNRKPRKLKIVDTTDSWPYTTSSYRQARATATNQVEYVCGLAEDPLKIDMLHFSTSTSASVTRIAGIGVGSTTTQGADISHYMSVPTTGADYAVHVAKLITVQPVGYQYYAWLEYGAAGTTFYGDAGGALAQSGLVGECWG